MFEINTITIKIIRDNLPMVETYNDVSLATYFSNTLGNLPVTKILKFLVWQFISAGNTKKNICNQSKVFSSLLFLNLSMSFHPSEVFVDCLRNFESTKSSINKHVLIALSICLVHYLIPTKISFFIWKISFQISNLSRLMLSMLQKLLAHIVFEWISLRWYSILSCFTALGTSNCSAVLTWKKRNKNRAI